MKEENDRGSDNSGEGLMLLYAMPDGCLGRFTGGGRWFSAKKKSPASADADPEKTKP